MALVFKANYHLGGSNELMGGSGGVKREAPNNGAMEGGIPCDESIGSGGGKVKA